MKRLWLALTLVPLLLAAQSSGTLLNSVSPNSVVAGSGSITITLTGSGFTQSSLAIANQNTDLQTNFLNSTTLTAVVPASLLQTSSLLSVSVFNSDTKTLSAAQTITITSPNPPVVTSIFPSSVGVGTTNTVSIFGSNLLGGTISFEGGGGDAGITAVVTSQSTATRLIVTITSGANVTGGNRSVFVTTPAGRSQSSAAFTVFRESWQSTAVSPDGPQTNGLLLPDGRVFYVGSRSQALLYDPDSDSWTVGTTMATPRTYYGMSLLPDGRVLIAGGDQGNPGGPKLNSAEVFDPTTRTWSPSGPFTMRAARTANGPTFRMVLLPTGKVIAIGGTNGEDPPELYDPNTGRWTFAAAAPAGSFLGDPVVLPSGSVLLMNDAVYDPFSDKWTTVPPVTTPPSTPSAFPSVPAWRTSLVLPDGRILIGGTQCLNCGFTTSSTVSFANVYDPISVGVTNLQFGAAYGTLLANNRVLATELSLERSSPTSYQSRIFDVAANTWSATSTLPVTSRMILLRNGDVLNGNSVFKYERIHAAPAVSEIATIYKDAGGQTLSLRGSGFLSNSIARLGTRNLVTIYLGSNKLMAYVPAELVNDAVSGTFTVVNSPPGGGSSVPQGIGINTAPAISGMTPASGAAGKTINATINGANLASATSASLSGSGVTVTIRSGATDSALPVTIAISADAQAGDRILTVVTPSGVATSSTPFSVIAAPPRYPSTSPQRISEVEEGAIRVGYAVLTPDAGSPVPNATVTFGMVQNGLVSAQAAVLPNPMTTDTSFFIDVVPGITRDLGVAIANPATTTNIVTLALTDLDGNAVGGTRQITISPGAQIARFVSELFGSSAIGSALRGRLRVTSATPFGILGLRFSGPEFSTLPPIITSASAGVPLRSGTDGLSAVLFPQFAMSGGWATQIALLNTSSSVAKGRIDLFDVNGNPMEVTLNNERQSTLTYSIVPGGAAVFAPIDRNGQSPF